MRSISANSAIGLVLTILLISSCRHVTERQLITGGWKYISVRKDGASVFAIGDYDEFHLNSDSTFSYQVESVKKDMKGTWKYDDHILQLKYSLPDTTRYFEVDVLSKHDLRFHEGDVKFEFSRIE